jgi:hypothetical protein
MPHTSGTGAPFARKPHATCLNVPKSTPKRTRWSTDDAYAHGVSIPERYRDLCMAWFSGGGAASLPTPYAHRLDRY